MNKPEPGHNVSIFQSWYVLPLEPTREEISPKSCASFIELNALNEPIPTSSSNAPTKMTYSKKGKLPRVVFYKGCSKSYPPLLAQIEAAASASSRLTRPGRVAKVKNVIDEKGNVIGSISYAILGFKSLKDCTFTQEDLINFNAAESFVSRYVREDDDYHPDNGGLALMMSPNSVIPENTIVDIDFDSYYCPVSSEVKGTRLISNGFFAPEPINAFPYTLRDLREFPNIQDQMPCHWPTKFPSNLNKFKEWSQKEFFQRLNTSEVFEKQKWEAFLQEALIIPDLHDYVISRHFAKTKEAEIMKEKLLIHVIKRHNDLATILPHSPEFRKFVRQTPNCFDKVNELFQRTDKHYVKNQIMLKKRFFELVRNCLVGDLVMILFEIGSHIHKNYNELLPDYHKLLNHIEQFHESKDSFDETFKQFNNDLLFFRSILTPINKEWSPAAKQFLSHIRKYQNFCENKTHFLAASIFPIQQSKGLDKPLDTTGAPKVIAREISNWLQSPGRLQSILSIIKECKRIYEPSASSWDPRYLKRQRSSDFDIINKKIQESLGNPDKIIDAVIEFFKDGKGAWNQAWFGGNASANVLMMDKLCAAALEDFKNMLSPKVLRNHELAQVCFLIKNEQWKPIEHAQRIAEELKMMHIQDRMR
jgi:hypothetical protein